MITLSVLFYIGICLTLSHRKYQHIEFNSRLQNVNPCYLNGKKSLLWGFIFIPKWLFICGSLALIVIGTAKLFVAIVVWIITYLP